MTKLMEKLADLILGPIERDGIDCLGLGMEVMNDLNETRKRFELEMRNAVECARNNPCRWPWYNSHL